MANLRDSLDPEGYAQARRRRLIFIWLGLISIVAVASWFVTPHVSHRLKAWHARRYAQEALVLIEKEQWREAAAKANDAWQMSPAEPDALRAVGRLLTRQGESRKALEWWARLESLGVLSLTDRRDYTAAALAADELGLAAVQIDRLLEAGGPLATPLDLFLAAQLNARRLIFDRALAQAQMVLNDPRATSRELFSTALLIIGMTNPESAPYHRAWNEIQSIAFRTGDPLSLDALALLARQAPPAIAPLSEPGNFSDLRPPAPVASDVRTPPEIAASIEAHPKVQPVHKLLALELRIRHEPARTSELIDLAIAQFSRRAGTLGEPEAGATDEDLLTLANWLNANGHPGHVLRILSFERARQRQFAQVYVEAFAGTGQWEALKQLLAEARLPLEPFIEHVYLALARTRLGETVAGANEWQRAIESAKTAEQLFWVGTRAEQERVLDATDAAFQRAISLDPKFRPAYEGRFRLARARGQTAIAREVAGEIVRTWPNDRRAQLEALYLQLLLGPSPADLENAARKGEDGIRQNPADWDARKTLALARLKAGENAKALELFTRVRVNGTEPPGALAVRAAVLAANGWSDGARNDAHNLGGADLLPEERALIAPLLR